jgi:hypothetical protein
VAQPVGTDRCSNPNALRSAAHDHPNAPTVKESTAARRKYRLAGASRLLQARQLGPDRRWKRHGPSPAVLAVDGDRPSVAPRSQVAPAEPGGVAPAAVPGVRVGPGGEPEVYDSGIFGGCHNLLMVCLLS